MTATRPYGPNLPPKIPALSALQMLCLFRNNEMLVRLYRVHLSIILNLTGIAGIAVRIVLLPENIEFYLFLVGGIAAATLNWLWIPAVERNSERLGYWNGKIEELERKCGIEGDIAIYTAPAYQDLRTASDKFRTGWRRLEIGFIVMWVWISVLVLTIALLRKGVIL